MPADVTHGANVTAAYFRGESLVRPAWQALDWFDFLPVGPWRASKRSTARRHGSRIGRALQEVATREALFDVWGAFTPAGVEALDPVANLASNLVALGAILDPQDGDTTPVGALEFQFLDGTTRALGAWVPVWAVTDRGPTWAQVSATFEVGVFA